VTSPTLALARELIARPSVTPDDAGCQALLAGRLAAMGFHCEPMRHGTVDNLWARRGTADPLFVFAGHTDVVPPGPASAWTSPPFAPQERGGMLYGRGAADMKGSIAAMLTATEAFVKAHPEHRGAIGFLITSDEEGPAVDGTVRVMQTLEARGEKIAWCLVGEPSCQERLGDTVKNGRRGSLNLDLTVQGVQGHVAYPHLAENPVHRAAPALAALANEVWDTGNEFFPPTSFQISNIQAGTGADNVIPGECRITCNFRFNTCQTPDGLQARLRSLLDAHGLKYSIQWRLSGMPFLTPRGELLAAATTAIREITGIDAEVSTSGGTSDGRFIAPSGAQVLEFGPLNASIHKRDEHIALRDLEQLHAIYLRLLQILLIGN
jgi:succinyl-diaminopimelate desuccinylase